MRAAITFLILFNTSVLLVNAQQLITVQHLGTPTFYTDIALAINGSLAGDTIYIPGGVYPGSNLTISKELHLIGVGHNPNYSTATDYSILNSNIYFYEGADHSSVTGLLINGSIFFNSSGLSFIHISRCNLGNNFILMNATVFNSTVSECILNYIQAEFESYNNAFYNNIFLTGIFNFGANNLVANNVFVFNGSYPINSILSSEIRNNIFLCVNNNIIIGNSLTVKNNLVINSIICDLSWICSGNINAQPLNSIFVNYPQTGAGFSYSDDYHLQATSPGKNAGTDGTDIGIYGGAFPWKDGSVPYNPHITVKNIASTTDSAGKLNIYVTVVAQDH